MIYRIAKGQDWVLAESVRVPESTRLCLSRWSAFLFRCRTLVPTKQVEPPRPIETVTAEVFPMVKSVLIAEDHVLTRQALCSLFAAQEDFDVCGDAENGQEAVEMAQVLRPDLIVMDLSMPVMDGIDATRALRQLTPAIPIIVFSEYSDMFSAREARSEGISALVSKADPVSVLLDKARAVVYSSAESGFLSQSKIKREEQPHVHSRS
jgi:CheY-like chemotaxis protein